MGLGYWTGEGLDTIVWGGTIKAENFKGASNDWKRAATLIVAASDSLDKTHADYICDGTADEVEINAAIAALPATGGKILLMDGTFNISTSINLVASFTSIGGQGDNTILALTTGSNAKTIYIGAGLGNITIEKIRFVGKKSGSEWGIYIETTAGDYISIQNCQFNTIATYAIYAVGGSFHSIKLNNFYNNKSAIYLGGSINYPEASLNTISSCLSGYGLYLASSSSRCIGNIFTDNERAVYVYSGDYHVINSNLIKDSSIIGVNIAGGDYANISNNLFLSSSIILTSDKCSISSNTFWGGSSSATKQIEVAQVASDENIVSSNSMSCTNTTAKIGIKVATGCNKNSLNSNIIRGNYTTPIENNGTGTLLLGNII